MSLSDFLHAELHKLERLAHRAEQTAETPIQPILRLTGQQGSAVAIQLGIDLIASAEAGAPWATLLADFLAALEKQGIQIAHQVAEALLNLAKASLLAKEAQAA